MTSTDNVNRRNFLKALVMTAAAATTTGGGAALLLKRTEAPAVIATIDTPAPPTTIAQTGVQVATNTGASELRAKLAAAHAENLRLQTELDAALRRLEAASNSNGDANKANEALQLELATANEQASLLAGLVALYEQLDGADVTAAVDNSLHSFGQTITDLVDELPTLEEGLSLGEAALESLEAQIPLVQSGRLWLSNHVALLDTLYRAADGILNAAASTAGSFLTKINEWFQGVRKWLPFGVGDTATEIMDTLTALLVETPNTIQGIERNVVAPLDMWLAGEGDQLPLRQKLITPLREKTISRANTVAVRVRDTQTNYQQQVVEPVQTAVKNRQLVREQIELYRKKYEL